MSATSRLTPVATEGPNIKLAPRPLEQDLLNHDAAPSVTEGVRMQFASGRGRTQYQTFMFWLLRAVAACNVRRSSSESLSTVNVFCVPAMRLSVST